MIYSSNKLWSPWPIRTHLPGHLLLTSFPCLCLFPDQGIAAGIILPLSSHGQYTRLIRYLWDEDKGEPLAHRHTHTHTHTQGLLYLIVKSSWCTCSQIGFLISISTHCSIILYFIICCYVTDPPLSPADPTRVIYWSYLTAVFYLFFSTKWYLINSPWQAMGYGDYFTATVRCLATLAGI